eukprot:CAMPEP_0119371316 /NCGR_PEP_ID=MMETSP1334-20130426/17513_1 /TAXON_ID=127549 /ORGANISM="Calcidiscus leptoporus, Strain RCC1130" /LENGTH=42 /DNA_ID= /DNA_START= /DNA_END= /DNA_ORIENTATION=
MCVADVSACELFGSTDASVDAQRCIFVCAPVLDEVMQPLSAR